MNVCLLLNLLERRERKCFGFSRTFRIDSGRIEDFVVDNFVLPKTNENRRSTSQSKCIERAATIRRPKGAPRSFARFRYVNVRRKVTCPISITDHLRPARTTSAADRFPGNFATLFSVTRRLGSNLASTVGYWRYGYRCRSHSRITRSLLRCGQRRARRGRGKGRAARTREKERERERQKSEGRCGLALRTAK